MKLYERISATILVAISLLIAVLDISGSLESIPWLSERIPSLTLIVLASIVTYLAFASDNREREFVELKDISIENTQKLLFSLKGVSITVFDDTEAGFNYLCQKYESAEQSVDHSSLAPPLLADAKIFRKYEQAVERLIKNPRVTYRYLAVLHSRRWKLIRNGLMLPQQTKYFVRYYDEGKHLIAGLSFSIIDDKEVILRHPYDLSERGKWLSIQHPEVVKLFRAYYSELWMNATVIEKDDKEQLKTMDDTYKFVS